MHFPNSGAFWSLSDHQVKNVHFHNKRFVVSLALSENIVILTKFPPLTTREAFILTSSSAANDKTVAKMKALSFQWGTDSRFVLTDPSRSTRTNGRCRYHVYHSRESVGNMMTSSNGNIFRVTGHLCGEFTSPRWIPRTKAIDAELWCFLWSTPE